VLYPSAAVFIPVNILESPNSHRSAVSSVLLALASEPEGGTTTLVLEFVHDPGGRPTAIARDALLLARMKMC
jgi:hypothetical protein